MSTSNDPVVSSHDPIKQEKEQETDLEAQVEHKKRNERGNAFVGFLILIFVYYLLRGGSNDNDKQEMSHSPGSCMDSESAAVSTSAKCYIPPVLTPAKEPKLGDDVSGIDYIRSPEFFNDSLVRFQELLRIPTVCYDDMGDVGDDDRFDIFAVFQDKVRELYPNIFKKLKVEYVNTYGLLITLEGSNKDLKPLVLMGHQDVVPVNQASLDRWYFPPFSATYHNGHVYSRGAADDKNSVVAILEALEILAISDYKPEQTVIASFGFDEEVSGYRGALPLAHKLYERYGKDGVALILDEGGFTINLFGTLFATVCVAEKGYMDVHLKLKTPGGHASIPPPHTNIGLMSKLVTQIEEPFGGELTFENPFYTTLQCFAENSADMDDNLRQLIKSGDTEKMTDLFSKSRLYRYFFETSIAVDVINGGVKVNALPEETTLAVNHRVDASKGLKQVYDRYGGLLEEFGHEYHVNVTLFNGETVVEYEDAIGHIFASTAKTLEPSPVSPYDESSDAYKKLAGAIRYTFGDGTSVTPALMPANTDTRHYWNLTSNIYRWTPVSTNSTSKNSFNGHTINENMRYDAHMDSIEFFYNFILVSDSGEEA
ncbi:Vacuolar carboxypeptidase [Schizosaccharomyces pombe]|uniref:Uncharacterized carboxypeptidase C24C9.08 n=1 Tax=Schizosaccharomyces pombe (strain 972 / ATCC 24843) TaxID=284812 RepID=YE48_SCHPO|nr:putative carboxypeptidase [Schizosaccharomyces pombe]O13968.1 RecName: Full=Uncharacterized carboxypeptidase C24C9.08 [Schizosaccharomyces pombe 972h-]CAB11265.1 vacuolar carboxypeptidase (predicted) [Schizosaccharomyces pombe]|eukprot:NP_001342844.1 putative carboxypeptidase [Schizosaccharomyces pombe]